MVESDSMGRSPCKAKNPRNSYEYVRGTLTPDSRAKNFSKFVISHIAVLSTQRRTEWCRRELSRSISGEPHKGSGVSDECCISGKEWFMRAQNTSGIAPEAAAH